MRLIIIYFILLPVSILYGQNKKYINLKKYKINYLNDTLKEISGLTMLDKKLYAINDGGNANEFYELIALTEK